jgi:uncharacterized lipoprotein YddW (UPF0748 family)
VRKIRGVWLTTAASNVFDNNVNIVDAIKLLADTGFNTVFPVVWNNGYTLYPSNVLDANFGVKIKPGYEGRDILQEVIDAATPLDIDVIPWFEYGFMASFEDNGGHILKRKPNWVGKGRNGDPLVKDKFVWMNSLDLEVQDFILSLILEVAQNYKIAGIQGDDHLAMPSEGGYDDKTKKLHRAEFGENPPADRKDRNWLQWRADILTDFIARLYQEVKAINSDLIVSMSPSIYPFGFNEFLQDFPAWIERGIVDIIHPQLYRRDLDQYKALVDDLVDRVGDNKASILSPGVLTRSGNYQITSDDLWKSIHYNRRSGCRGEVLFFFESLKLNNNDLANFLKEKNYADFLFMQQGDVGDDVREIQQKLKTKGFYAGIANGVFNSATKDAVIKFQQKIQQADPSFEVDGVVGSMTYAQLA